MKTAQQIFNKTLHHLRKQGVAAIDEHGNCAYRTESGASCAVGCHITKAKYSQDLEGKGVKNSMVMEAAGFTGLAHANLLQNLQGAHDTALRNNGLKTWEASMQHIAVQHRLTYTATK